MEKNVIYGITLQINREKVDKINIDMEKKIVTINGYTHQRPNQCLYWQQKRMIRGYQIDYSTRYVLYLIERMK